MRITYWLWLLWGAMIISIILKQKIEIYIGIALIVLPILIVILQLQEEINNLKEESKYQKRFITDRITALSEKVRELSENFEKKIIVDFAEFAKNSTNTSSFINSNASSIKNQLRVTNIHENSTNLVKKKKKLHKKRNESKLEQNNFKSNEGSKDISILDANFADQTKENLSSSKSFNSFSLNVEQKEKGKYNSNDSKLDNYDKKDENADSEININT